MKRLLSGLFALVVMLAGASAALAESGAAAASSGGGNSSALPYLFIAAGFGMAIGTIGPALAQGRAIAAAVEAMARNPGVAGKIQTAMLIGLAMIEALAIYALVVALVLMFVIAPQFL